MCLYERMTVTGGPRSYTWFIMMILTCLGCEKTESVSHYSIPKEAPRKIVAAAPKPGEMTFDLPSGWRETKPRGGFAAKSFATTDADPAAEVTVTPLQGGAGGLVANANRWRGQLGLEPMNEAALKAEGKDVEAAGGRGILFDFVSTGPGPRRIVGVVREQGSQTWFFKMSGDAEAVASAIPGYVNFVKSVRLGGGGGN